MNLDTKFNITLKKSFKNADLMVVEGQNVAIVQATGTYITIDEFKSIFNYIGDIVKKDKIKKLIFDKRKLTVFHQPSMEWYFVEWKEKMYALGLTTHRKILPENAVFVQSVKIGREQIAEKYPKGKFNLMDIAYCNDIDEGIEN
jgi:hypothetical protein